MFGGDREPAATSRTRPRSRTSCTSRCASSSATAGRSATSTTSSSTSRATRPASTTRRAGSRPCSCVRRRRRRSTPWAGALWDRADGPRRGGGALLRVPAGRVLADRGDRRRRARCRSRSCCCAPCGSRRRARCAGARRAGAAAGLAIGFKYTAGLVRAVAARWRWRWLARPTWRAARALGVGSACWPSLRLGRASSSRRRTSSSTSRRPSTSCARRPTSPASRRSSARSSDNGFLYYLGTPDLGPRLARRCSRPLGGRRAAGAARPRARAALLLVFPLALFVYLSLQARFFGRWLLPAYPVLALLAGVGARPRRRGCVGRRGPRWPRRGARASPACSCWQPLAADVALDGGARPPRHPRGRARLARGPPAAGAAGRHRAGRPGPLLLASAPNGTRGRRPRRSSSAASSATSRRRGSSTARTLSPRVHRPLPRAAATALVMTMSLIRGRSVEAAGPGRRWPTTTRLERESKPSSPSARTGSTRSRSRSTSTSPTTTTRPPTGGPGPQIDVYRLDNCTQGYGRSTERGGAPETAARAVREPRTAAGPAGCAPRCGRSLGSSWRLRSRCALWHLDHGLPFAYNARRGAALRPAGGRRCSAARSNPGYFENPPALTYLLLRRLPAALPFGGPPRARRSRPTPSPRS